MTATDLKLWARETLLEEIDDGIRDHPHRYEWGLEDENALLKERNRVAKFLGLEPTTRNALLS